MGSTKHEKSFVDFEKPYEQNLIGLKGIIWFGGFLFLLIVITFGLMWYLLKAMQSEFAADRATTNPMVMNDKERLPPEPRLQVAPGFKIDGPNGSVNLELKAPQAEFWEFQKQWHEVWEHGEKDPKTGATIAMPIDVAKEKFLEQKVKARSGDGADKALNDSRMFMSDASSGRLATEKRR